MSILLTIAQWAIASFLFLVFLLAASLNLWIGWRELVKRDYRGVSVLPVFGGLVGSISIAISPLEQVRGLWWVPALIDYGCIPYLLLGLVMAIKERYFV